MSMPTNLAGEYNWATINGTSISDMGGADLLLGFHAKVTISEGPEPDTIVIRAKLCNRIFGTLTFADGKFKGMLISTYVGCSHKLMEIERAFCNGCEEDTTITRKGDILTLANTRGTMTCTAKPAEEALRKR